MTGTFRFFLAVLVVAAHLVGDEYTRHFGYFAVGCFFVLSGYAMTASLHDVYGFQTGRFWRGRFWRLAPLYFVACLLTALVIHAWPAHAQVFFARWRMAPTSADLVDNFVVLPLAFGATRFRYLEQSWSLSVEIFMYALLCLGMARNARLAAGALILGALYHVGCLLDGASFGARYFALPAALLPFGIGSLAYFLIARGGLAISGRVAAVLATLWLVNIAIWGAVLPAEESKTFGFYANLVFCAPLLAAAHRFDAASWARRVDEGLGRLSYPVYLMHWVGGFLAHQYYVSGEERGWTLFALGLLATLVAACALVALQSWLFDPVRRAIRAAGDATPARAAI